MKRVENYSENYISKNQQYLSFFIACIMSVVALVTALLIGFSHSDMGIYRLVFLVPLLYGGLNLVFFNVYNKKSFAKYVLFSLMFIRYVLGPLAVYLDMFPTNLYNLVFSEETIVKATFLMCFEMSCMFGALWLFGRRKKVINVNEKYDFLSRRNFSKINPFLFLIILVTLALFARYPALIHNYYFIFNQSIQETSLLNQEKLLTSIPNGLRWVGYTLGEITHYVVISYILAILYKKYEKNSRTRYIYIAIFIILLNATITTSRQMLGLIISAVFYIQLLRMFKQKRKMLINIAIISGLLIVITLVISYFTEAASYHKISSLFELYTNGFYGVYQSLQTFEIANIDLSEKYKMLFLGDTLSFVNVLSTLFSGSGQVTSTQLYNNYLYGTANGGGQIVPMISQGYLYFGFLFSTVFSVASVALMYRFEERVERAKGCYLCNMFLAIAFAVAPIMYNFSVILVLITTIVVPLYIASIVNNITIRRQM